MFFCRDVQFVLQFWHFFCICTCINFFYDKPIGAVPGRNYVVVKRMVRTTINLVFYNIIRYDTSKKGENAPLGLRIKRANRWFNPPQASLLLRDEDDWGKLKRVLKYLNGTKYLKLRLTVVNLSVNLSIYFHLVWVNMRVNRTAQICMKSRYSPFICNFLENVIIGYNPFNKLGIFSKLVKSSH